MTPAALTATTTTGSAVAFNNVHIGFGEAEVLRGVSFTVPERETLVLMVTAARF